MENGNIFPHYFTTMPDHLVCLFFFFPQRGSDELSMYNSPNSGMGSISGEFVPTTPEWGGGGTEFACSHLIRSDRRH